MVKIKNVSHHFGKVRKHYVTKGDLTFLKKDGELYISRNDKLVYVPKMKKVS
jgi:hypothetical protein